MKWVGEFVRRRGLEAAVVACVVHLAWLAYVGWSDDSGDIGCLRNDDYPRTHIGRIDLDLASPNHWVRLTWAGPGAADQDRGPFRSSPGAGGGTNDCNDAVESNCPGSLCTPKGARNVEGHDDHLQDNPQFRYVTWIDRRRAIAFHAYPSVPPFPASQGCVRLEPYPARLIYDNSIKGKTEIVIGGTWTNPREERAARIEDRGGREAAEQISRRRP